MPARNIEQVAVHVADVDALAALLETALGIRFGSRGEAVVEQRILRVASSEIGLTLVEVADPAGEGLRAIGLRVDDLGEVERRLAAAGHEPVLEIARGGYRELQYDFAGVRFSLAEYPDQPIPRLRAAADAGILTVGGQD